jgi:hypothetical protein
MSLNLQRRVMGIKRWAQPRYLSPRRFSRLPQ